MEYIITEEMQMLELLKRNNPQSSLITFYELVIKKGAKIELDTM